MMGIKLPPIREKHVEDTSTQVPSSRPHIPLGTGRHLFPSLAIATCQWDDSADADVQEILELSFDELNSVLMQIEPGVSGQQIARALDSLSDHPNLKNVKTILTLSLDRVVAWSTGPTYPLIEAKLAEPRTAGSSSSFLGADPGDGIVVLATSPVPLLLVAAPNSNRFSFHISSLVSRTYRALTSALDSGRAAAVGLAGFRPCLVTELQNKLTSNGYAGIAAVQVDYSLVDRRSETTRFLEFCLAQSIVVLGSNPIPPKLKQAMATPLLGDATMGARNHNADIYRILNQSSLLNIGALKGVRRSSFDLNAATLDPYTPLVQAVQNIAKSRHLPWEAIAINYAMVKGTLPLLQPTSREEMDRCHQAVGWRLTFNELTTLDRVSLPLAFKPKSRSQQQLLMPLKRLLARPSKPNLKAQAAAQPGNCKNPPPMSPHRISIDLPLQNLLASPTGNRKMSLTIEGEGDTGEEVGRWRADITLSFIPSANPPLVSLEARPRSVAMGESDGTVENMPERLPVGLLTPSNSSRPFSPPFFCDDELLFPAPPQRPWSPIAGHLRPASWSGQSPYTHHFLAKPDSFDTPSLPRDNPSHLAYSQSQLLFDLELESSSPWNLSPKLPSISTISSKDTQN